MTKSKNLKKLNNQLEELQSAQDLSEDEYEQLFQNRIFFDKEIQYNLGLCELMLGNKEKAAEYLRKFDELATLFDGNPKELD